MAHIELVGDESRLAGQFRGLVDRSRNLQDDMRHMKLVMDGTGATATPPAWTAIEAIFGFKAGDAEAAYNLLKLAAEKINSAPVDSFCNLIG